MNLTLQDKNRGIKVAWFFMIITIGAFLSEMTDALDAVKAPGGSFDTSFEIGYVAGGKLWLITLLGMGMLLYTRTKRRRLGYSVWGSEIIEYILAFILSIHFVFPLLSGRWVNGSGDDTLAFFYVSASLLAYIYALLAKTGKEKQGINIKKLQSQLNVSTFLIISAIFFGGFILGRIYTMNQRTIPTYYECLQLGSDSARKACIRKYDLKDELPTTKEIMKGYSPETRD